ncbi:MAG: NTP transferase domain-containing protein [Erysipelotrichaceae bacterium]|nr:NTP transferase domain-containing protein [Erysipelotrichaceae bacterium]
MSYTVDNAIIMAAGTSSRFAPLSYERSKALTEVRGEILIERQIRQLREAGIENIIIVTGYKSEQLEYLKERFGVQLIHNPDYLVRNNNGSIHAVRELLGNSYICSADNYFTENPFEKEVSECYYAAEYSEGETAEWCMTEDEDGFINSVTVGGRDSWYMLGHAFWSRDFSREFIRILEAIYDQPETVNLLWESIFMQHLDTLKMHIRKYAPGVIYEFDTLDELRQFDESYVENTRSVILKELADELGFRQSQITEVTVLRHGIEAEGFSFLAEGSRYEYDYETGRLQKYSLKI